MLIWRGWESSNFQGWPETLPQKFKLTKQELWTWHFDIIKKFHIWFLYTKMIVKEASVTRWILSDDFVWYRKLIKKLLSLIEHLPEEMSLLIIKIKLIQVKNFFYQRICDVIKLVIVSFMIIYFFTMISKSSQCYKICIFWSG